MIRSDSLNEDALQRLILDPSSTGQVYSREARQIAQQIHSFFLERHGWRPDDLRRYRFRDLAIISAESRVVPALLRSGDDLVQLGGVERALELMKDMSNSESKAFATLRLGIGTSVQEVLREKSLLLSDREWAKLELLAQRYSGGKRRRRKDDRRWLGSTLLEMLERAYGGE